MRVLNRALAELDAARPDVADGIPRHFHMTARSKALAGDFGDNVRRIQAMHPQWTFDVHDDEDIVAFLRERFGPATLEIYQRLNPRYGAARADFFRYCCVYLQGGVYLDSKSTTRVPLESWLRPDDQFILSQWVENGPGQRYEGWGIHHKLGHVPGGEYQQWFVIARPGHPFLKAVIARVLTNIANAGPWPARFGRDGVFQITGPVAYTLAIHPMRASEPHRLVDIEQLGVRYSMYETERSHYNANGPHYSSLQESVVLPGSSWAARAFALARALAIRQAQLKDLLTRALARLRRSWGG